ncbi:MAG: pentapeptide repeat-containing protein [Bacteroidetes bacterium]|nr:pentapeptide repeat-containing protein [Bacteroidota bacterium]
MKKIFVTSKFLIFIFIFSICLSISFTGCSDSLTGTGPVKNQARTEEEFVANPQLKADAGSVVVVSLEDLNSPPVTGDTGPIGEDIIPYSYTETAEHRFTIDDSSYFSMKLVNDLNGEVILNLNPGSTATVSIPAGNYKMHLTSLLNYSADEPESKVVFIQANWKTPHNVSSGTYYSFDDLDRLLSTNKCRLCNLDNANLAGKIFPRTPAFEIDSSSCYKTILAGAKITGGRIANSLFSYASLKGIKLDSTLISNTRFDQTNMNDVKLSSTKFLNASFSNSTLSGEGTDCNFESTLFTRTNFVQINIPGALFLRCNLSGSTIVQLKAQNSVFDRTIFDSSTITSSILSSSIIKGCLFSKTQFKEVDVRDANFCESNSRQCVFNQCTTNAGTLCWPF